MTKLKPVSPGELLSEEFLKPMGISQYRLAKEIGVPAQRIGAIMAGKRAITADTGLRLCRFFGLSDGYWLRAQAAYDTEIAQDANASRYAKAHQTVVRLRPSAGAYGLTRASIRQRRARRNSGGKRTHALRVTPKNVGHNCGGDRVTSNNNARLAVLIDAGNAQASILSELLAEVSRYGVASVERAYGCWTTPNLKGREGPSSQARDSARAAVQPHRWQERHGLLAHYRRHGPVALWAAGWVCPRVFG